MKEIFRTDWVWVALALGALTAVLPARGAETLTPRKAVKLALENHPVVRAAGERVAAAQADKKLAHSGYLPRLDATEDYVRGTNPVFVFASKLGQEVFGPADFDPAKLNNPDPLTNSAMRLVLRQNVWDAGRTRLGNRAAQMGIEAAQHSRVRTREEVAFGAERAFWDARLADEMLRVARDGEKAAQANADLVREMLDAGMVVRSDLLSAQVRLAEVTAMRIRAEQSREVSRAALRQALGLSEDREFRLEAPEVKPGVEGPGPEEIVREALARRGDLLALKARIGQAEIGEKMARSRRLPVIGVGGQYEWNDDSLFGTQGSNWTIGAMVRVPVFDGFETGARVARARAQRREAEAYRLAMEEGIRLQVKAAHADWVAASKRLEVAESALENASEALRIVQERYREGMAVIVELLGAEASRTAARGNRAAAARDLALARAALDLAAGKLLQDPGRGTE